MDLLTRANKRRDTDRRKGKPQQLAQLRLFATMRHNMEKQTKYLHTLLKKRNNPRLQL
jgi:hypothetical protein